MDMEMPAPQKEHQWLQKLVGEWTIDSEGTMGPDQPPNKWKGTEIVRSVGDLWIVAESKGEVSEGCSMTMITTLGYDPQKGRFVGTFIGSMMTRLWLYDGALDASERVLTLDTEGPNMVAEGKMARFQDIYEIIDNDHHMLTSRMLSDDGQWRQFMTSHYRRMK